jgi:carboxypeptidase family protein
MNRLMTPATVLALMLSSACAEMRHGQPIVGGSVVPNPTGTVSGTVTTTAGSPLEGRRVSAINVATEQHYDVITTNDGGYTIQVPPGRYRLEVELRGGDRIARQPQPTNVHVSDLDEELNFVIGP